MSKWAVVAIEKEIVCDITDVGFSAQKVVCADVLQKGNFEICEKYFDDYELSLSWAEIVKPGSYRYTKLILTRYKEL